MVSETAGSRSNAAYDMLNPTLHRVSGLYRMTKQE